MLLLLIALSSTPKFVMAAEVRQPNVLIVMTDDQGLGDFAFTGNPVLKTPHLDEFARQAVRLSALLDDPSSSGLLAELTTRLVDFSGGSESGCGRLPRHENPQGRRQHFRRHRSVALHLAIEVQGIAALGRNRE